MISEGRMALCFCLLEGQDQAFAERCRAASFFPEQPSWWAQYRETANSWDSMSRREPLKPVLNQGVETFSVGEKRP